VLHAPPVLTRCERTLQSAIAKMKFATVAAALLPLAQGAMFTKEQYESGEVMDKMMAAKEVLHFVPTLRLVYADEYSPHGLVPKPRVRMTTRNGMASIRSAPTKMSSNAKKAKRSP